MLTKIQSKSRFLLYFYKHVFIYINNNRKKNKYVELGILRI